MKNNISNKPLYLEEEKPPRPYSYEDRLLFRFLSY